MKFFTSQVAYNLDSQVVVVVVVAVVGHSCLDMFHIAVDLAGNADSYTDLKRK